MPGPMRIYGPSSSMPARGICSPGRREFGVGGAGSKRGGEKGGVGIRGGEFRLYLFVGQPVGSRSALDRGENHSQGIIPWGFGAQHAANEFSDATAPREVAQRFGRLR